MTIQRKITAHLPADLLDEAQRATGKGVTETLRIALQQLAAAEAYEAIRRMRGKLDLKVDLKAMREDRR